MNLCKSINTGVTDNANIFGFERQDGYLSRDPGFDEKSKKSIKIHRISLQDCPYS